MDYLDNIIDQVGETATVRNVVGTEFNEWGDGTDEIEEVEVMGRFEMMNHGMDEVEKGEFANGDLRCFIPYRYEEYIRHMNLIEYRGRVYEFEHVEVQQLDAHNKHIFAVAQANDR